ncbi:MAG: redoxin domain-containing protein [Gemmatimonadales bacterium]|nr:redoxin domain-containing protein [Gemmatimonadales bacterium]
MRRSLSLAALLLFPAALTAQGPVVGDAAPAVSMTVAGKDGVASKPVSLASLKGKVVVLAFFPRARTSGCTIQMKAYRDRFDELFGKDAELIAISTDTPEALAAWAKDEAFPFRFGSDVGGNIGRAFAVANPAGTVDSRVLFVIGKDGKIAKVMRPFREIDPTAYDDLKAAIQLAK